MTDSNFILFVTEDDSWGVGRTNAPPCAPTKGTLEGKGICQWIVAPAVFVEKYRADHFIDNKLPVSNLNNHTFMRWLEQQAILAWVDACKSSLLS